MNAIPLPLPATVLVVKRRWQRDASFQLACAVVQAMAFIVVQPFPASTAVWHLQMQEYMRITLCQDGTKMTRFNLLALLPDAWNSWSRT